MPATTGKGAPYPVPGDNNNVPADIEALAEWVDERPGVSTYTTAQRDALNGPDLWDGRTIWNTTLDRQEVFSGGVWGPTSSSVVLDFGEAADLSTSEPGDVAVAGGTGEVADAAHQHAREAFGFGAPNVPRGDLVERSITRAHQLLSRTGIVNFTAGAAAPGTTLVAPPAAGLRRVIRKIVITGTHDAGTPTAQVRMYVNGNQYGAILNVSAGDYLEMNEPYLVLHNGDAASGLSFLHTSAGGTANYVNGWAVYEDVPDTSGPIRLSGSFANVTAAGAPVIAGAAGRIVKTIIVGTINQPVKMRIVHSSGVRVISEYVMTIGEIHVLHLDMPLPAGESLTMSEIGATGNIWTVVNATVGV